jgi:hypothetical protein
VTRLRRSRPFPAASYEGNGVKPRGMPCWAPTAKGHSGTLAQACVLSPGLETSIGVSYSRIGDEAI